ncbi:MAG TPA: hypothetical protein VFF87_04420 [Hyphomicrobium sp.]|nr:hypothetical protein [Hyphomicrobium sp.]
MSQNTENKDIHTAIERLTRENAELNGLVLATGVILTQLLQAITLRELNPWNAATRIVDNAEKAIAGFPIDGDDPLSPVMKDRALKAVKQFEDQLRSVLPT